MTTKGLLVVAHPGDPFTARNADPELSVTIVLKEPFKNMIPTSHIDSIHSQRGHFRFALKGTYCLCLNTLPERYVPES